MALVRPTLLNVAAFDATQEFTFTFTMQGTSSQVVANQLTIRNNDTNDIVYQEKQETFRYEHILNAEELTNGIYYNATLTVFDAQNNESQASIPIQFWCYSTPVITFTNMPDNDLIQNSSFSFEFTYSQAENEALNSYIVNLYNSSQILLSSSGYQYPATSDVPYNGSYMFNGFDNNTTYYIQIVGTTVENTIINSNLQQFTVQYSRPDIFTLLYLVNNCDEGYITIQSNIITIDGTTTPDPPTYINNQEIDLTESGSNVEWTDGFSITGDMLTRIWLRNPNNYSTIMQFSNVSGQIIKLDYMLGYENVDSTELQSYFTLSVYSALDDTIYYYIYSNYVDTLPENEYYVIYLTRINDIYQLQVLATT